MLPYIQSLHCHDCLMFILFQNMLLSLFARWMNFFFQQRCDHGRALMPAEGPPLKSKNNNTIVAATQLIHECMQHTPKYGKLHQLKHVMTSYFHHSKVLVDFQQAVCSQTTNFNSSPICFQLCTIGLEVIQSSCEFIVFIFVKYN